MNLSMDRIDYYALLPFLFLMFGAIFSLLIESVAKRGRRFLPMVALTTILFSFIASLTRPQSMNPLLTHWLSFGPEGRFFSAFFLALGGGTTLLSLPLLRHVSHMGGDYLFLLLSALFGLLLLSDGSDLLTLFLGLEIFSLSLYVISAYTQRWDLSYEGSFKYLIMGAASTAFLLFGIALIYGATGSTNLAMIASSLPHLSQEQNIVWQLALGFISVGILFKAAAFPFHTWLPELYTSSSTPITAFMSVGTKAAAFVLLLKIFPLALIRQSAWWTISLACCAAGTLIYGNITALTQVIAPENQLRRFFAYSGISHTGLLLLAFCSSSPLLEQQQAIAFYLLVYGFATLGAFSLLEWFDSKNEGAVLSDLQGLFYTHPLGTLLITLCLLTLGGIPPTAGFFAKFYLIKLGFLSGHYLLVAIALLSSVLAAFYYLKIISLLFSPSDRIRVETRESASLKIVRAICLAGVTLFSFFPEKLLFFAQLTMP